MAFDLKHKVAIVTGAQRGIGLAIVRELASAGANVVMTGIEVEAGAAAAITQVGDGLPVTFRRCDTTNPKDVNATIAETIARFGRLNILVANAAIYPNTPIASLKVEEWDAVMAVNLRGPFLMSQACLPQFQVQKSGRVVFLSSITGPRVSSPGYAAYATTKAGILGFMRTAALEWAPWNITVNAVEPGNILTEGFEAHQTAGYAERQRAAVPLHRLGTPAEVAHTVRFLVSDEAAYITGQTIVIDGGQTLPEMPSAILPKA